MDRTPSPPIDRCLPSGLASAALAALALLLLAPLLLVPWAAGGADLTLATALDPADCEAVIQRFERASGLSVDLVAPANADRPITGADGSRGPAGADVYWGRGTAEAAALAAAGLLAQHWSPFGADAPERARDPGQRYTTFVRRLPVLLAGARAAADAGPAPVTFADLLEPRVAAACGVIRRGGRADYALAGLRRALGDGAYHRFVAGLDRAGARTFASAAAALEALRAGQVAFALVDGGDLPPGLGLDPSIVEIELALAGDRSDATGSMESLAIFAQAPHPEAARRFLDFVLAHAADPLR